MKNLTILSTEKIITSKIAAAYRSTAKRLNNGELFHCFTSKGLVEYAFVSDNTQISKQEIDYLSKKKPELLSKLQLKINGITFGKWLNAKETDEAATKLKVKAAAAKKIKASVKAQV